MQPRNMTLLRKLAGAFVNGNESALAGKAELCLLIMPTTFRNPRPSVIAAGAIVRL